MVIFYSYVNVYQRVILVYSNKGGCDLFLSLASSHFDSRVNVASRISNSSPQFEWWTFKQHHQDQTQWPSLENVAIHLADCTGRVKMALAPHLESIFNTIGGARLVISLSKPVLCNGTVRYSNSSNALARSSLRIANSPKHRIPQHCRKICVRFLGRLLKAHDQRLHAEQHIVNTSRTSTPCI